MLEWAKTSLKRLLSDGYEVIAVARSIEKMDDLKSLGAMTVKMDITQEKDIVEVVELIQVAFGRLDVLMNNAGYAEYGAVEVIDLDTARRQFEVNLFGLARLTQLIIPIMRKQGYGKIINTSSVGGKVYSYLGAWYHATKHALEGWSDCLRLELKQFGIDVIIIEPGAINTEFGGVMLEPMTQRAKGTVYQDTTDMVANVFQKWFEQKEGSEPSVITDLVMEAINAKKPKRRYAGGKHAKQLIFIRKWFGDGVFEKALMSIYK
ncbi:MAG: oxidoreductase [Sulfurimonas sp.]|nr:oxidoreductase [Sulfurimonas sp.]